jgi:pimeloyl-ACP methyl ester carboxylesterase
MLGCQVVGQGPPDLVMTTASFGDIDVAWEDPGLALSYRTLASFSRLILLNRRGTGASDPLPPDPLPPWESYAQELDLILDEVGSQQAALLATLDAGPMALFLAATRPERTSALILAHITAKCVVADDYPIGVPAQVAEAVLGQVDQLWGTEAMAATHVPSRASDVRFRRWFAKSFLACGRHGGGMPANFREWRGSAVCPGLRAGGMSHGVPPLSRGWRRSRAKLHPAERAHVGDDLVSDLDHPGEPTQ